jgi:hypothetical protein
VEKGDENRRRVLEKEFEGLQGRRKLAGATFFWSCSGANPWARSCRFRVTPYHGFAHVVARYLGSSSQRLCRLLFNWTAPAARRAEAYNNVNL